MTYISELIKKETESYIKERKAVRGGARPASNQKSRSTGHEDFPPAKMHTGSSDIFINGMPASRRWDIFKTHSNEYESHKGMLYHGSDNVFGNDLPMCRAGDRVFLEYSWSDGVGATDELYIPEPIVCQPKVGVGGTTKYPSLHIHKEKEDSDDFTYVSHPLLDLCWSLYYDEHRMPFISGVGIPLGGCDSAIMTGSDDVNIGRFEEQVY